MPVPGRKPKPDGQKRTRHPLQHQFIEVPNVPFDGGPDLPGDGWTSTTLRWWDAVRRMPHCVLWTTTDWEFAFGAALVRQEFEKDPVKAAPAMLNRDKALGTTLDARRDLRIRYVEPAPEVDGSVAKIDEYRTRLASLDEATEA